MRSIKLAAWLIPLAACPAVAEAREDDPAQDLSGLSIEELADIPVESASKQAEPLSGAPTALYVITGDAIRRSNATSLPEAMRLAPNLQVQRTNAREYAITARGFNGIETSNKLLLLLDGRSAYSTLHSGIFWELRSPLLEDVAQIEVVSGPGGTLFGPNAVNGVISVVSKDATDTLGVLARGTAGHDERTLGGRIGFGLGEGSAVRVSANYYDREGLPAGAAADAMDGIRGWQAAFRADTATGASHLTLAGEIFESETFVVAGDGNRGHSLRARWRGDAGGGVTVQLQAWYDYFRREQILTVDSLETMDVEGQFNFESGGHSIVGGLGVRTTRDEFTNALNAFGLDPASQRLWIVNGFLQDRFEISPQFAVIAGAKLESSTYSGAELLPNLRLAWQPNADTLFWAAVSRAVRTPSRIDRDLMTTMPFLATAPDFRSEKLVAFELGYRGQPGPNTSLSVSLFYNDYDHLRSLHMIAGPAPVQLANDVQGNTYGFEAWGNQQMLPWWRLSAGVALLRKEFEAEPGTVDLGMLGSTGDDPGYQFQFRSQMDLPGGLTLDAGLRAVDSLDRTGIPAYAEAEARIGWAASEKIEIFAMGNNLLHKSHFESGDVQRGQRAVRAIRGGARLRF